MKFSWQGMQAREILKLLGTLFGLTLSAQNVDRFLLRKLDKKIQVWSQTRLNLSSREVVANGVLSSNLLYFQGIWEGSKAEVS
jgi:hypothetical protein